MSNKIADVLSAETPRSFAVPTAPGLRALSALAIWLSSSMYVKADLTGPQATVGLLQQETLLDTPGGLKSALRDRGISLDLWWTQFYQGPFSGSGERGARYGGKGDIILRIDGGKAGLWNGFSINIHQEILYGQDLNTNRDGTLFPVNTALAFPRLGGSNYDTSVYITQAFSPQLAVSVGKFNLLDFASQTPIVGGGGLNTFMNTALAAPISGVTPPYLLGAIVTYKTSPAIFTLMVYDPRNAQSSEVLRNPFAGGVTASLAVTFPLTMAGLQGFYSLRGVYSTKSGIDLANPVVGNLPSESGSFLQREGYKYGQINVQQFLYQDPQRPNVGWGLFADASLSDGNPNPFAWRVTFGLAGNNLMPGRERDRWGIGYFKYELSSDLLKNLDLIGIRRKGESGLEAFYDMAVTPWFRLSADIQWIDPFINAEKNTVISTLRAQVRL